LRRIRKRRDAPQETLLDLARQRPRVRTPKPTGHLRSRQPPRQLQQGERTTARFGDDPILDALVEAPGHHRLQKLTGITAAQTPDQKVRQTRQLVVAWAAHREHHRDSLREQTTRNERERLRGDPIETLGVIDHADQRLLLRDISGQAEHRQPDQESVRWIASRQTESGGQRIPLRAGKAINVLQHRGAQQVKPGKRQLHLGLDTCCPNNATS
jgi:hypothetical protein